MEGCPLHEFDDFSNLNYNNETTCSPETIMNELGNVKSISWLPLITMKEELINHMKEDSITDDISFSKIDELSDLLIDFMKDFNEYKNSMDYAEKQMKLAIDSNQKDIQIIDTFIEFLGKISSQTDKDIEPIQSQIKSVCEDIKQNSKI